MNPTSRYRCMSATLLAILALGIGMSGCKTDPVAGPERAAPDGPVVDPLYPPGVELPEIQVGQTSEVDLVERVTSSRRMYADSIETVARFYTQNTGSGALERTLIEELIRNRAMYGRHLRALITYYTEQGDLMKARWAENELADFRAITPYQYITDPEAAGEPGTSSGEIVDPVTKAEWAQKELYDFSCLKPYRYLLDAEVPLPTLRPVDSIAEADRLYEEGLDLMEKGGHGTPIFYHERTMKRALAKFKRLVDEYPTSDKIDDAAFYIGEIHKEYFGEDDNVLALLWYQRALDWNPSLPHPARFQMAVVYDYRLHERDKALALYQEVLEKETFNESNVDYAAARIEELTPDRTRHAPGEPTEPLPSSSGAGTGAAPAGMP